MSLSTPRQRPSPSTTSTPSNRPSGPHLAFSPLSHTGSLRSVSASSVPSYQPSIASSSFGNSRAPPRYLSSAAPSIAPSNLGSIATTANPGSARFRRGHVRNKANAQTPSGVTSVNPDLVDLLALEEPDEVFRTFGVRDVRKIEQRASDAANAKVAELRAMVGERYRDLLAAADSIVRMRGAADKLLDRLESVESAVLGAGEAIHGTTPHRRPSLIAQQSDSAHLRTLANPPTLSLTLHLFLNLASLVHSLIEQSKFLSAARLENLGRVVWTELEGFSREPPQDMTDEEETGEHSFKSVRESFPIAVKHHESMGQLGPLIVRRATAELRSPNIPPTTVAQILASLILLDHASLSSSLSIFLKARSQALSSLLAAPRASSSKTSSALTDAQTVKTRVEKVLDCVLKTVEAVDSIFTSETPLLPQYLKEIEHPSSAPHTSSLNLHEVDPSTEPKLQPILTTLPNYPTLARHLSPSILSYNPFLTSTSSTTSKETISETLSSWLQSSTSSVLDGINEWITSLISTEHPALVLSSLRDSVTQQLSKTSSSSSLQAETLRVRLTELIESRLNQVYTLKLSQLVENLESSLDTLLSRLSTDGKEEGDSAKFLFSIEIPHQLLPIPTSRTINGHTAVVGADPFSSFLNKVGKRVDGRTRLVDEGLEGLEKGVEQIREDLRSWLSSEKDETRVGGTGERERNLREKYVEEVGRTIEGVVETLERVIAREEENAEQGISNTLFIGTFAQHLSRSRTFIRDLFLGVPPSSTTMLETWQSRLSSIQGRSLHLWQEEGVKRAIAQLRKGSEDPALLKRDSTVLPNGPSTFLIESLNSLLRSLESLPAHRLYSNPSPATSLLKAFSTRALEVAREYFEMLGKVEDGKETKTRLVWDLSLIGLIMEEEDERENWERARTDMHSLLPSSTAPALEDFSRSATTYLLRTQSIYSSFFPNPTRLLPLSTTPSDPKTQRSTTRLLPLGPPPPATQGEFKSLLGVVQPGPRLGLLPTKG